MSTTTTLRAAAGDHEAGIPPWLTFLLASACGLIAANLYYSQPLVGPISAALGLSPHAAGLIVTMTQLGYGLGLLLVVPLGDLFENRRLVLSILAVGAISLAAASVAMSAVPFLIAALFIGIGSVSVQVLVPYAANLTPEATRGRVVGNVMSGLMLGIMLARPVAGFITDILSWHAVFTISAIVMVALGIVLRMAMPVRRPAPGLGYSALLRSMVGLALHTPVLQRRAVYHACMFAAFSLFWTTVPLLLSDVFRLTQTGIALFSLAGVAGAISAPIAGRVADRGLGKPATGLAMLCAVVAFLMTHLGPTGSTGALAALVAAAILLDFGMTANLVLGQREIFSLGAAFRNRLNGLYMAFFFLGGALGSAVGGWAYAQGGWGLSSLFGLALPVLGLIAYATEWRSPQTR